MVGARSLALLLAAVAAALLPLPVHACSVCGCGDPLVAAGDSSPLAGGFRFAFDYAYLTATAQSDDDAAQTESLTQMTFMPVVVYSPTDWMNLVLQIPLPWKSWSLSGGGLPTETASPFGLGDLELGARFFVWRDTDVVDLRRQNLAISVGTSMPTGSDDTEVDGERIDQHAQLGTGAWGPYLGLLYAFHQDPWNFFGSVTGRYRTTNSYGYQFGAALLWDFTLRYRIVEPFAVSLGLDGRYAARDSSNGELQSNTGGFVLAATPGIAWNVSGPFWLYAQVQLPFATHLFGVQSVGPVVTVGLQYVLN
ncbi:MAG TPA: transporter [Myxococcaceae bacterium]|nr:transporter [Myxococcaceae bacterium]